MPTMRQPRLLPSRRALHLAALLLCLCVPGLAQGQDALTADDRAAIRRAHEVSRAFALAARRVTPAVVNISSSRMTPGGSRFGGALFSDIFPELRDMFVEPPQEVRSLGSGVIIRPDGVIITNQHVIQGAQEILVTLPDQSEHVAKVVGQDAFTDVAVIKIEATGLPVVAFGDSNKLEVGEWVLAVGSPLGLSQTVTAGIVSAKGRRNMGISGYEDFIQTDAAINPGNSGGALVNLDGELVGLNTAIATQTGGYQGVCFATPTSVVRPVVNALIRDGKIRRPWIGVIPRNLDRDLATRLGLPESGGVMIQNMVRNSPAHEANLAPGDVITTWQGKPLHSRAELSDLIQATPIGSTVKITVIRDGKTYPDAPLPVRERPDNVQTRGVQ